MRLVRTLLLTVVALILALAAVMLFNSVTSKSRQLAVTPVTPVAVDKDAAAKRLAGAVRFKTISYDDGSDASAPEFVALHDYLKQQFPLVHANLTLEKVGGYSLLFTWPGSDSALKPAMFMAHQDVVPIAPGTEQNWLHEPFSGDIADGYIWGRGSWDDKSNLLGILEATEMLLAKGVKPKRTMIIASGHDEEISGERGAKVIAALLKSRKIELEFVIDEGSIITEGLIKGIEKPIALIGLAEKGSTTLQLAADGPPGHSSMPPQTSVIGTLSNALNRLATNQMPGKIAGIARASFETLAPEMSGLNRVLLSNLWLTEPLVRQQLEKQGASNAMLRTTTALTVFYGGNKSNVLPGHADALVNFRILPGDTIASVADHASRVIADPAVKITQAGVSREASPVSPTTSAAFGMINTTIQEMMPGTIVAPGL